MPGNIFFGSRHADTGTPSGAGVPGCERIKPGRRYAIYCVLALVGLQFVQPVLAQSTYPERKPVILVVPATPGSGTDIAARIIAEGLAQTLGQKVIVDNRPGAGSAIGLDAVAKSAPDGYVIGLASTGSYVFPTALEEKRPYNALVDLVPVALTNNQPLILVSTTQIAPRTLREFVTYAKSNPTMFATAGPGTGAHLLGAAVLQASGAKGDAVHYKASAAGMPDVIAGRVQFVVDVPASVVGQIKDGRLVGLGIFASNRLQILPEVPTFAEAWPEAPDFMKRAAVNFIVAPAKLPADVMVKLNTALNRTMADPGVRARMEQAGFSSRAPASVDQASAYVREQVDAWTRIVNDTGVKAAVKATN